MKPLLLLLAGVPTLAAQDRLPNTAPLDWPEPDLSTRLMDGAHAFVERQIAEAKPDRARFWKPDITSRESYDASIAANRERFKSMIGLVDPRVPADANGIGNVPPHDDNNRRIRWPVMEGITGEGLHVMSPLKPFFPTRRIVILIPDADQTPEEVARSGQAAEYLKREYHLYIPALINRSLYLGSSRDDPKLKQSNHSHREWIYRQAYHMGRHIVGYEVQRILALVDHLQAEDPDTIFGVAGYGEGGMLALYAAACDPRLVTCRVSGYGGPREMAWSEPIYRNLFGQLREFGDREIAMLIGPYRKLEVVNDAPPSAPAAKGEIRHFHDEDVRKEFEGAAGSLLTEGLGIDLSLPDPVEPVKPMAATPEMTARHQRLFQELEDHVQKLIAKSGEVREQFFLRQAAPELWDTKWTTDRSYPTHDPAKFIENARAFREKFDTEAMGRFDEPLFAPEPRSRKIAETEKWTAYDVVLDVYFEMFAWGVLVLPKGMKPEEKRPVVICQHGRNGLPRDCLDAKSTAYNDFAAKLAERGFITFAPHNLYRGEERYRILNRKANTIGCTLFSFITPSHRQILNWLKTQPNVDPARIAFYGLSYGGETAMRVPPLIVDYAAVICSGDFNQWTRKVAAVDFPNGFMKSIEWEMPYWNLGHTFDYSDMAALIFPRPFMVERGHHDRVSRDEWVAFEYAKVRWLYAQYGFADRTEIEFFQGGHSLNGQGTFRFLHRHLNWPEPGGAE